MQSIDKQACGSDQTPYGPLDITYSKPQNMAEERFLAMLRLEEEQRSKLEELPGALVSGRDTFL